MNWFLRLSIKNKLTVIILAVTSFAVGLGCTVMLLIELSHNKQQITENAMLIAQITGAYVAADVAVQDQQAIRDALNPLKDNPNIINIHIYGANGNHLVSLYEGPNTPSVVPAVHTVKIAEDGLYVVEPLNYKGQNYGSIYQIMSIAPIQAEKIRHIVASMTMIITVLFLSVLLANRLQSLYSGPIIKLIAVAKQISQQRNYTLRASTNSQDEIGELYKTFNEMMERINQHEIELLQSEEKWRAVTENTPDIIMLVDAEGKILFINHTLPNFTREEVIGRFVSEFVPAKSQQTILETYQQVFRTGIPGDYEVEYQAPQGAIVYESRVGPIKNNKISGLALISRDITRRKLAEVAMARAITRLANLRSLDGAILKAESPQAIAGAALENINALVPTRRSSVTLLDIAKQEVYVLEACGTLIDVLAKGERFALDGVWGDLEDLQKGKVHTVDDIASLVDSAPVAKRLAETGIKAFHIIPLLVKGELVGTLNLCAATAGAFTQEDVDIATEVAGVLAIAIEQANLKEQVRRHAEQMEQRVIERTVELEVANKELESFSYSVSHDLRAPLRSIDGFSQMVLEEYKNKLDPQGVNYLQRVRNASQRMGKLIDDLLDLSRINRSIIDWQWLSVDELASTVINTLRENEPQRNVEFIVHNKITAYADPQLLRLVLENLLGNAWKFTSRKAKAVIELGEDKTPGKLQGKTAIYVKDNGAGFDMNYAGNLFGAFQRLHSEEEFSGTGVGLASVQRIVHRHGGEIWAEGEVGHGAVFYFTLGHREAS